jgi:hypothetical protein
MNTVTLVAILLAAAYGGAAWLLRRQYGSDGPDLQFSTGAAPAPASAVPEDTEHVDVKNNVCAAASRATASTD